MKLMGPIFDTVIQSDTTKPKEGDYIGEDGLLYCGKCHTRKQYPFNMDGKITKVHCICRCEQEEYEKEQEEIRKRDRMEYIKQKKMKCIQDRALLEYTFQNDDGSLPQMKSAHRYVETWEERKKQNDGLLLWGNVGTGKTFYAACIANALIENGTPVLMTNFAKILNKVSGIYSDEKNVFIHDLMQYDLLILDDFGIERNTEYALEQIYNVIDERYKTKLPLIITTNLSLNALKNPQDTAHQRIYDRVLSMCVPVSFIGESHRKNDSERKICECRELFE